jgi:hypothetical protein
MLKARLIGQGGTRVVTQLRPGAVELTADVGTGQADRTVVASPTAPGAPSRLDLHAPATLC